MRFYIFFVFITTLFLTSCCQDKFILMVEQPVKDSLNNKVLRISLGNTVFRHTLQSTDIVPTFKTYELETAIENKLLLQLDTTILRLDLTYPNDKYIIISPTINSKGNIHIGVIKQADKFIFH